MYSIGEFSRATGVTVRALRFYHEEGVLVPARVDGATGYRYYGEKQIEVARVIAFLRRLEFPLSEIKGMLADVGNEERVFEALERQRKAMGEKVAAYRKVMRELEEFILLERQDSAMKEDAFEIREKVVEPMMVAGIRMKGKYSDCGKGFGRIGKEMGRFISGKPLMLHYDTEFKEEDADFEACMPVRRREGVEGISVRELEGARCVTLVHRGPYEELGRSYAKVLKYVKERGYGIVMPTREVYVKGPGMIFKGNPRNYLTEIQIPVEGGGNAE